jgi:methyltransferase
MPEAIALLAFVTLQRAAELAWGRSNERRLRRQGAVETGAGHYPLIVALHAAWLVTLWVFGWSRPLVWPWVAVFLLLQGARVWVLATLGRRWTTRVLVVPGEALIRRGPYRLVSHPNYLVVALEIPTLPLAFGLPWAAVIFGLGNLALLALRIRVEAAALRGAAPVRPRRT